MQKYKHKYTYTNTKCIFFLLMPKCMDIYFGTVFKCHSNANTVICDSPLQTTVMRIFLCIFIECLLFHASSRFYFLFHSLSSASPSFPSSLCFPSLAFSPGLFPSLSNSLFLSSLHSCFSSLVSSFVFLSLLHLLLRFPLFILCFPFSSSCVPLFLASSSVFLFSPHILFPFLCFILYFTSLVSSSVYLSHRFFRFPLSLRFPVSPFFFRFLFPYPRLSTIFHSTFILSFPSSIFIHFPFPPLSSISLPSFIF